MMQYIIVQQPGQLEVTTNTITMVTEAEASMASFLSAEDTGTQSADAMNTSSSEKNGDRNKPTCSVCGKMMSSSSALKRHMRIHLGVRPFPCTLCDRRFTQSNDLVAHMRTHTGSRPFKCDVCSKGFTSGNQLKNHKLVHTGEKKFECSFCGKRFSRKHHMLEHTRIHRDSDIRCQVCLKGFTAKNHLNRHMKYCHSEEIQGDDQWIETLQPEAPTETPIFEFEDHQELIETATIEVASVGSVQNQCIVTGSIQLPTEENKTTIPQISYKCELCDKAFFNSTILENHVQQHISFDENDGKGFKCTECDRIFSHRASVKRHMVVHTKEKPYECEDCLAKFTQCNDLKIHKRIHTGDKPFVCDVCNKGFYAKQKLKVHYRQHSGEKPYSCHKCEKKFYRKDHLRAHVKSHENDHLKCHICSYSARDEKILEKHVIKHCDREEVLETSIENSSGFSLEENLPISNFQQNESTSKATENNFYTILAPYNCNICKNSFHRFDTFIKHCKIHENYEDDNDPMDYKVNNMENYKAIISGKNSQSQENSALATNTEKSDAYQGDISENNGEIENCEETYCCSHCGKLFLQNADLVKHMETHTSIDANEKVDDVTKTGVIRKSDDGRYICTMCGKHFASIIPLQSHIKNIHSMDISNYQLNYNEAERILMNPEEVKRIEKQIEENLRFTGFDSVVKCSKAEKKKTTIFQCEFCAQTFRKKERLDKHRTSKHIVKYRCELCSKTFRHKHLLKEHKSSTHGVGDLHVGKIYECEEPDSQKSILNKQLPHNNKERTTCNKKINEAVFGKNAFLCRRCKESFQSIEELESHVDLLHSDITDTTKDVEVSNQVIVEYEAESKDVMTQEAGPDTAYPSKDVTTQEAGPNTAYSSKDVMTQEAGTYTAYSDSVKVSNDTTDNQIIEAVRQHEHSQLDVLIEMSYDFQKLEKGSVGNFGSEIGKNQEVRESEQTVFSPDRNPDEVTIPIAGDTRLRNQSMIQCQIINSETGITENVLIPVEKSTEGTTGI